MFEPGREGSGFPEEPGSSKPIVVETDGGTVPIVEPSRDAKDKRKDNKLPWREAKLSLAHAKGSRTPIYGGSIAGGVEAAGRQLLSCGARTGFGASSQVHAVGDGTPWIVGQVEEQFGDHGRYLIDFYHVCEYLSAAAANDNAPQKSESRAARAHNFGSHPARLATTTRLTSLPSHLLPPQEPFRLQGRAVAVAARTRYRPAQ